MEAKHRLDMILRRARKLRREEAKYGYKSEEYWAAKNALATVFRHVTRTELLVSASAEGRDVQQPELEKDIEMFLANVFFSDYWKHHYAYHARNVREGAKSWLQGLPNACSVTFSNFDIVRKIQVECAKDGSAEGFDNLLSYEDEIVEGYWTALGISLAQMYLKHTNP